MQVFRAEVKSDTSGKTYIVSRYDEHPQWRCSCWAWLRNQNKDCKHILSLKKKYGEEAETQHSFLGRRASGHNAETLKNEITRPEDYALEYTKINYEKIMKTIKGKIPEVRRSRLFMMFNAYFMATDPAEKKKFQKQIDEIVKEAKLEDVVKT